MKNKKGIIFQLFCFFGIKTTLRGKVSQFIFLHLLKDGFKAE